MSGLVLDHTALAVMGSHQKLAAIIVRAHRGGQRAIGVPALCLAAAEAQKAGLSRHVGYLPSLRVVDLTRKESGSVGALIAFGADWRAAQAIVVARQYGYAVVTLDPSVYQAFDVETITLPVS